MKSAIQSSALCLELITNWSCDNTWKTMHTTIAHARLNQRSRCKSTCAQCDSTADKEYIAYAVIALLYLPERRAKYKRQHACGSMGDVYALDVAMLNNLQIGKSRRKTAGTSSQKVSMKKTAVASTHALRSGRNHTEQDILRHVQCSVLQKYCTVCESLNVDPLRPHTLGLIVILLSRHTQRTEIARNFLQILHSDDMLVSWDTAQDLAFLQQKLSASSDWSLLLGYVDFEMSEEVRAEISMHPVLCTLQRSLLEAGIVTSSTPLEFVMTCFLFMTPAGTPSPKMLERFLSNQGIECRDVEVKCLRAVTSFTDQINNEGLLAACLLHVCLSLRANSLLVHDLEDVLAANMSDSAQPVLLAVRRIRLRDIVESVHQANALSYELSFDSWCCQKKFASTTGLNVQRLLYFINAQTCPVDFKMFPDYFTPAMTGHLALKELSTIDIAPIIAVICSLRLYTNNIKHLIDFRVQCLEGLNVKARQNLSQAQILQLYICCFQHESIRDRCWRAVLPVLNHSIQRSCVLFRENFEYEIEAVLRSVIFCHVNNAQGREPALQAAVS